MFRIPLSGRDDIRSGKMLDERSLRGLGRIIGSGSGVGSSKLISSSGTCSVGRWKLGPSLEECRGGGLDIRENREEGALVSVRGRDLIDVVRVRRFGMEVVRVVRARLRESRLRRVRFVKELVVPAS